MFPNIFVYIISIRIRLIIPEIKKFLITNLYLVLSHQTFVTLYYTMNLFQLHLLFSQSNINIFGSKSDTFQISSLQVTIEAY